MQKFNYIEQWRISEFLPKCLPIFFLFNSRDKIFENNLNCYYKFF